MIPTREKLIPDDAPAAKSPDISLIAGIFCNPIVRMVFSVIAIGLFAYASIRVMRYQAHAPDGNGDWGVYYRAGLAMRHRQPIYTLEHGPMLTFKNLPAVALLIAPLTLLPIGIARWLWLVGDLACLSLLYHLAGRVIFNSRGSSRVRMGERGDEGPSLNDHISDAPLTQDGSLALVGNEVVTPPPRQIPFVVARLLIAGAVLLSAHYIFDQLFSGSITVYFLTLTVAAFTWAHEGKGIRAGSALALAICLKIVPLAFVPWLFFCRRPVRSLSSLAGGLALLILVPALWIGWNQNVKLLRQWPAHISSTENHEQVYRRQNQSLYAMLTRFLTPPPDKAMLGDGTRVQPVNFTEVNTRTVRAISLAISAAAGLALYGWAALCARRDRIDAGAILSLLILLVTICNPLAWRYNFLALGVPYLYVLHAVWSGVKQPKIVMGLVAASYVLHFAPDAMQGLSARFWGAIALGAAVFLCHHSRGFNRLILSALATRLRQ